MLTILDCISWCALIYLTVSKAKCNYPPNLPEVTACVWYLKAEIYADAVFGNGSCGGHADRIKQYPADLPAFLLGGCVLLDLAD